MTADRPAPLPPYTAAEVADRWRVIPEFPRYRVSADGRIQSTYVRGTRGIRVGPWHDVRTPIKDTGYLLVRIYAPDGVRRITTMGRLVAELFIPNPEALPCVRHVNGIKTDNRMENLAWGTHRDNEEDKRRHGTYDLRRNGTLNMELATQIRARRGESYRVLAAEFGVHPNSILRVLAGTTWR